MCIVGFFGNRRTELPFESVDSIDVRLLDEFSRTRESCRTPRWSSPTTTGPTSSCTPSRTIARSGARALPTCDAVEMSPELYSDVRIYNGHLPDGVAGNRAIEIDSTKYWDYDDEPMWRAIRVFDPPLTRVRRQEPQLD